MRALLVASLLVASVASGALVAQTLEESYATLCSDPAKAKSEACQVLAQSLMAKLQGQQTTPAKAQAAPAATTRSNTGPELVGAQRWGFFADIVDQELVDHPTENPAKLPFGPATVKYAWDVPGDRMGAFVKQADGSFKRGATLHWDSVHRGLRETTPAGEAAGLLQWQPDGSIVSNQGTARMVFRRLPDGAIEIRVDADRGQGWVLVYKWLRHKATPANVENARQAWAVWKQIEENSAATAKLMAEIQAADAALKASPNWQRVLAVRAMKQQEHAERMERARNGGSGSGAMFGAILQGLSEGYAEANTGGYAEAQANLDATVANIQAAAAAESAGRASVAAPAPVASTPAYAPSSSQSQYSPPAASLPASAPSNASAGAGATLRFIFQIPLRTVINRNNASCYSNIVSIPGPAGWPNPSTQQGGTNPARALVDAYIADFMAKCSAIAPLASSQPNFHWNLQGTEPPEAIQQFGRSHGFPFVQL